MPNLYRANYNKDNNNFNYSSEETRGDKNSKIKPPEKKKVTFKQMRKNTVSSLNDVEKFLGDFKHFIKYVKLYKLFK